MSPHIKDKPFNTSSLEEKNKNKVIKPGAILPLLQKTPMYGPGRL